MKCNVTFRIVITEKLSVNTPKIVDGKIATEKAMEKLKKKYKGKEIEFLSNNREYKTFI